MPPARLWLIRLATLLLVLFAFADTLEWLFIKARWRSGSVGCGEAGACWGYVYAWLDRFLYGFYPTPERWRVGVVAMGAIVAGGLIWLERRRLRYRGAFAVVAAWWLAGAVVLKGGIGGLASVELDSWGGLLLTLTIAATAMSGSMVLGLIVACARLSNPPVIALLGRIYIEFWRGIPLITVLFLAVSLFPLMMPHNFEPARLVSVLVAFVMFYAAYVAEVFRAGFIALPPGQQEAARALGLNDWQVLDRVLIPQCLRRSIPAMVNVLISILKDTTLVLVIGLFDLLGMVQQSLRSAEWGRFVLEGYLFAGVVIWVFCFGLSRLSKRLEMTGH